MTVYVDRLKTDPTNPRALVAHMVADTTEELDAMARRIGLDSRWIQNPATPREHYDLTESKRRLAVEHGAVEVSWRQMGAITIAKRKAGAA